MTEVVNVGLIQKTHSQLEVRRFEVFHDSLGIIPRDQTAEALTQHRLATAEKHLITILKDSPAHVRLSTIMRHALASKTQELWEIECGARSPNPAGLNWLEASRSSLTDYAKFHDLPQEVLETSIFFTNHYKVLRRLGEQSLRFAEPFGQYQRYAFIAGVATGQIKTRYHSSASLRRPGKHRAA